MQSGISSSVENPKLYMRMRTGGSVSANLFVPTSARAENNPATSTISAYWRNSIVNGGAPEAALLRALITAEQRKAIVISVIPSESLWPAFWGS